MSYEKLTIGDKAPEIVNAVIEIPSGQRNKYEIDKETGLLTLDRVLFSPFYYPVDYGYIPTTLADDGDALDILVVTDSPVAPGVVVRARVLGVLMMSDDKGKDEKIIAVPYDHPRYKHYTSLESFGEHFLNEIVHFFSEYKRLEKKNVTVGAWEGKEKAFEMIKKSQKNYTA